jgi:hypothetical protein
MVLVLWLLSDHVVTDHDLLRLMILVPAGIITYVAAIWVLDRSLFDPLRLSVRPGQERT